MTVKRIFFALPIPFGPRWGFWTRDSGLVVLALRKMGYDAWLVALGDAATETEGQPVLPVSLAEMKSTEWWKAQKPDAVVLCTWSAPRYDAIRKAALAATPRVVERLDTSGNRSARLFPRACYVQLWGGYRDRLPGYARWLAVPLAAARTAVLYTFPQLLDARMAASMKLTRALIAESPIAAARIGQIIETFAGGGQRVAMIPHPVNEAVIRYDGTAKENRIISVGRWGSAQKDFPLLMKVLKGFLQRHSDWDAIVVGSGIPAHERAAETGAEEWRRRIIFHDNLTHEQLVTEYSSAKIYVMVSRYESFCIAAAEALCCGCSVVGSVDVPSSQLFAQNESGAVAPARTSPSFLTTLDEEVESWARGKRNPKAIASLSQGQMGSHAVAEATVKLLEASL
jgi:glycosyltransferase involved in cell wall biosynthesis